MVGALRILDEEGEEVELDASEARTLLALTANLDPATVSACAECRCRVLATVALVDLLDEAPAHPRSGDLIELADEAPTLHLYVIDLDSDCRHLDWRDPGFAEWVDVVEGDDPRVTR